MGCDIHLFVETREAEGAPWKLTPVLWRCTWCKGKGKARDGGPCEGCFGTGEKPGWTDRNYNLFGILAGVRHDELECIAEPRGLPDDLNDELKRRRPSAQQLGNHSHSWLLLSELLAFGWDQRDGDKTYEELVGEFHSGFIPALLALGKNTTDVRIVFGFDS